ncbi:hypothetical protein XPA_010295 [Xanthoria parietina]
MAELSSPPTSQYFNLTYPLPYVAHVEINRPEKLNAFIEPPASIDSYRTNPIHIANTTQNTPPASPAPSSPTSPPSNPASPSLETCPKPIIAVLHGHCYGLGIDLSLCADLRICTPSAKFAVKEVDLGLAADVGTLSRLGKVAGNASWVKDVCISAREFDAQEALRFGFVSRDYRSSCLRRPRITMRKRKGMAKEKETAISTALQWASTVASKSPVAVQGTKELLNWSRDHSVADGLRYTAVWNGAMLQTEDVGRAMRAGGVGKGKEKKKPRFEKL